MSSLRNQTNNQDASCAGPHQELYIYYLKGRLKQDSTRLPDNCIGNWEEEDDSFLFFSRPAYEQVESLLSRQPQLSYIDSYHMPYEQWLGEIFTTFEHGKFSVIPPWETPPDKKSTSDAKLSILLDPGLVFGTGTHPTTRDCLEALELAACPNPLSTALDLGTGTGLLALAAARLGCKSVVAVDLNFLAAKTADRNVRLNHLQNRVVTVQGRAEDMIAYPADLVIANIHYHVMRQLVNDVGFLTKKSFVLSGLLRSEAKDIVAILARHPVRIIKQWTHEGIWHTIYGETKQDGSL
jgi:ribosomal protein L11 methyltransferase